MTTVSPISGARHFTPHKVNFWENQGPDQPCEITQKHFARAKPTFADTCGDLVCAPHDTIWTRDLTEQTPRNSGRGQLLDLSAQSPSKVHSLYISYHTT